jgi:hypothetical protein
MSNLKLTMGNRRRGQLMNLFPYTGVIAAPVNPTTTVSGWTEFAFFVMPDLIRHPVVCPCFSNNNGHLKAVSGWIPASAGMTEL